MAETMVFGVLSLCSVCIGLSLMKKRPLLSALLGECCIALEVVCAKNWLLALADSGKNTAFLGFERYPAAPVILMLMGIAAMVCIAGGVILLIRKSRIKGNASH